MPYPQKLSEQQILEEAARIVDEDGVDALSMRVLAARLGAHAPSLYRYFPDKETLVRAVSARFLAELADGRYPNRYAVIVWRAPEAEQPPAVVKLTVTEPLHQLAARLCPDRPLVATRVLWSYLHGAVSLRLAWPTREGLDPEEAFTAGLEALEAWLAADTDGDRVT